MNFLSVENLTKSFGDRVIFSDITFGIDQGDKVAIVAKNGNGKTTLLRCLMNLEQIDSGRVVMRSSWLNRSFRNGASIGPLAVTGVVICCLEVIDRPGRCRSVCSQQ